MRDMSKAHRVLAMLAAGSLLLLDSRTPENGFSLTSVSAATKPVRFDLQGHRGARGLRPENTLAAFSYALSLGVSTLEMDCAVTKDGVVVVSHDSELNPDHTRDFEGRWLEKTGPSLFSLSYDELRRYDVGRLKPGTGYAARYPDQQPVDGERIPRLADVFALVAKSGNREVRFNIETKIYPPRPELTTAARPFAEALVREIRAAKLEKRAVIQSFDLRTLKVAQEIAPEIDTVLLTQQRSPFEDNIQAGKPGPSPWMAGLDIDDFGGSVPKLVKASGARVWSPNYLDVDAAKTQEAHALGLTVIPWTANETEDMARVIGYGVDGLISDRPDRLRAVLIEKGIAVPKPTPVK